MPLSELWSFIIFTIGLRYFACMKSVIWALGEKSAVGVGVFEMNNALIRLSFIDFDRGVKPDLAPKEDGSYYHCLLLPYLVLCCIPYST